MILKIRLSKNLRDSLNIILISAALALIVNLFNPNGFIFVSKNSLSEKTAAVKDTISEKIFYITGREAKLKFDMGSANFIDSRPAKFFRKGHIKGAVNIPVFPEALYAKKIKLNFSLLNQPKEIVIYCTGESCGTSRDLAGRLFKMGYRNHIYIIKKGYPEWDALKHPVEREN